MIFRFDVAIKYTAKGGKTAHEAAHGFCRANTPEDAFFGVVSMLTDRNKNDLRESVVYHIVRSIFELREDAAEDEITDEELKDDLPCAQIIQWPIIKKEPRQ